MEIAELYTKRTYRMTLYAGMVFFSILNLVLMLWKQPWDPTKMGVGDPMRPVWRIPFFLGFSLCCVPLLTGWQASHPAISAPRGKYVPGQKYPIFTTRRWASIGILSALYSALAIGLKIRIDTPAVIVSLAGCYFGPFEGFASMYIGNIFRLAVLGGAPTIHSVFGWWWIDGSIWAINGWFWLVYVEPHYGKSSYAWRFAVWVFQMYMVHAGLFQYGRFWINPIPAIYEATARSYLQFNPITAASGAIGGVITAALMRSQRLKPWTELEAEARAQGKL